MDDPHAVGNAHQSVILPLVLMPFMRGARRFTLALGILNLSLTFFVTISGFLILSPEL
jgi:hypothetical protein